MTYCLILSTSMSHYWCKNLFLKAIRSYQSIMSFGKCVLELFTSALTVFLSWMLKSRLTGLWLMLCLLLFSKSMIFAL